MFDLNAWSYLILGYGILAFIWLLTLIAFYEIGKRVKRKAQHKPKKPTFKELNHYYTQAKEYYAQLHQTETPDSELEEEEDYIIIEDNSED